MALESATWYLGPLGDLRALLTPKVDLNATQVRYGGVHQAISGARTMDVTGFREMYDFAWDLMSEDDWEWLRALYVGHIPGPHYLINPMKKNRLSVMCTSLFTARVGNAGVILNNAQREYRNDFPVGTGGVGIRSLLVTSNPIVNSYLRFDGDKFAAVPAAESITCSVWMKAASAQSVPMLIDGTLADGTYSGGTQSVKAVTTAWQKFSVTRSGIIGARPALLFPLAATYDLRIAAPQLEYGVTATDFELGGGAPTVLLDQLTTTSHRFPLSDINLTMLEV